MAARIRLYGDRLDVLAKAGTKVVVERAIEAGIESAKRLVPVDEGDLQESIRVTEPVHETANGVEGAYGAGGTAEVDYEAHVEFGTSKMAAQPYMRPSIDAMKQVLR